MEWIKSMSSWWSTPGDLHLVVDPEKCLNRDACGTTDYLEFSFTDAIKCPKQRYERIHLVH